MNRNLNCSDEFDTDLSPTWCERNWYRLLFVILLASLTIAMTFVLIVMLYKDDLKEKALAEKRKDWIEKWQIIEPFVKKFPMGFILGFIRNLIVLAIERQID
ncbi:hypothetical protein I4U23_006408 [Adineta vaga]|nr:hypothetical protein I4U23_006408 [Adineta vaga]